MTVKLPRHTLLLEDELAELFEARSDTQGACPCREGPGGAPVYCRLGLPPDDPPPDGAAQQAGSEAGAAAEAGAGAAANGTEAGSAAKAAANGTAASGTAAGATAADATAAAAGTQQQQQRQHRLAVLIPYRDRPAHLAALLAALRPYLQRQGRPHDVFVVEQADGLLFNRGLLLNAAALLLQGSDYDHYCFQDVDTIPLEKGDIQYAFPAGDAPLHLTPNWLHPKSNFQDFFGGLLIITAEQFARVNGFGTQFWGWGREDDNLRDRLAAAGMWPPEYPVAEKEAGRFAKRSYFRHQPHEQAVELRGAAGAGGTLRYFQEDPRIPYRGAKIMSSQPRFLKDFATGLNTTMFRLLSVQPLLNTTRLSLSLHCNASATPWCRPDAIGRRVAPAIKHAAAVHAVVGS